MKLLYTLPLLVTLILLDTTSAAKWWKKAGDKKWDYLTFTQQWPQVSCLIWKTQGSSHECNITSAIKAWTIHGIWPSSFHQDSPSFCNRSATFNMSEIRHMEPQLAVQWANVYANTPEDQLWEHEWEKHGTCAAVLPQLQTEELFFKQGLAWSQQYNMLGILEEYGITPSSKTPIMAYDVVKAIENKLKVTPNIVCEYIPKHKTYYLFEIELCFDKSLKLVNCPSSSLDSYRLLGSTSCPSSKLVWYPEIEHKQVIQLTFKEQPTAFQKFFGKFMQILPYTW